MCITRSHRAAVVVPVLAALVAAAPAMAVDPVYVSRTIGHDGNAGTATSPLRSITAGLDLAEMAGAPAVHVAFGTYAETVSLRTGIDLFGGFEPGGWVREPDLYPTRILGDQRPLRGESIADVRVDGLWVQSVAATVAGDSSYGIYLVGCTDVAITNCLVIGGRGADGATGMNGDDGVDGLGGAPGEEGTTDGMGPWPAGGDGGSGGGPTGGDGGRGGDGGFDTNSGDLGQPGDSGVGGGGGLGGSGGIGTPWGQGQWNPDDSDYYGAVGADGLDGTDGGGGTMFGATGPSGYVAIGGASGTDGSGGGGGGGGGPSIGLWISLPSPAQVATNTYYVSAAGPGGLSLGNAGAYGVETDVEGLTQPVTPDCNANGMPDAFDIDDDVSKDIDFSGIPDECECLADTDGSGFVDIDDIVNVVLDFGTDGSVHGGDVNYDGLVDIDDVVAVVIAFGQCPGEA